MNKRSSKLTTQIYFQDILMLFFGGEFTFDQLYLVILT